MSRGSHEEHEVDQPWRRWRLLRPAPNRMLQRCGPDRFGCSVSADASCTWGHFIFFCRTSCNARLIRGPTHLADGRHSDQRLCPCANRCHLWPSFTSRAQPPKTHIAVPKMEETKRRVGDIVRCMIRGPTRMMNSGNSPYRGMGG